LRSVLSNLASLLSASFFVHGSNSAITTMIGITIAISGGRQSDVAMIAACYSLGFITGCFLAPIQIRRVGLIRAFAAATAAMTIAIVALDITGGVVAWSVLRFLMGLSIAIVLAVSDSWINDRSPRDKRGQVIAIQAIVVGLAAIASQMVFLLTDGGAEGFVLVFAITMNIGVVFVALTSASEPTITVRPARRKQLFTGVPLTPGVNAFASGFVTTSVVSVAPFTLTTAGLQENHVAMMLAALYFGRLVFQWPVGWVSDRIDRRWVLIGLSAGVSALMVLQFLSSGGEGRYLGDATGPIHTLLALVFIFLLGGAIYPMYTVASGLAFDRAEDGTLAQTSTTLLALSSTGAIVGPFTVMIVGTVAGSSALSICLLVVCSLAALVSFFKQSVSEAAEQRAPIGVVSPQSVEMAEATAELIEEKIEHRAAEEVAGPEEL
jgi:MFS family permease